MRILYKQNQQDFQPQRVLPFRRVFNFRDLGGYPAAGGTTVKWGVLFRSGQLAKMDPADLMRLARLNLDTVVDFRSDQEREKEPNQFPASFGIRTLSLPIFDPVYSSWGEELREAIETKNFQNIDPFAQMGKLYQDFVVEYADQFKRFIHVVLAAQGRPVLWHCAAGKDRTGFAAAILLRLLGVQQEIVLKDYLLSSRYADRRRTLILFIRLARGKEAADIVKTLLAVYKEWMQTAFRSIDEGWGSFERYSYEALDLSKEQIDQLRFDLLSA